MPAYSNLTRGLNLWGFSAGVNMQPGEALNTIDMLPRGDGGIHKHWGWMRINPTTIGSRIVGIKGFNYKGKNNNPSGIPPAGGPRVGNYGLADDGAVFTLRTAFYAAAIVLSEADCRVWNSLTGALDVVALPAGVGIVAGGKPSMMVIQNNVYICGWTTENLRYDPVDRALYVWGWDNLPANAGHTGLQAGGTLLANRRYIYRLSWIDLYTGEESGLSVPYEVTTTAVNMTVLLDNFIAYAGNRHYVEVAPALANQDVGIVVYRTGPDGQTFHFLDIVNPGLAAATVVDNGLATDVSLKADVRAYQDHPPYDAAVEFRNQIWGISWNTNWARVYFNDFRKERSFFERWDPRNYRELPLQDGDALTALSISHRSIVAFSRHTAYEVTPSPNSLTGTVSINLHPTNWPSGCVGPRAWAKADNYLYWLSDRGPWRVRMGMKPEWIGRPIQSMFFDPETGLCQLNEGAVHEAEAAFDPDSDTVRFIFTCGSSPTLNRHIGYWHRTQEVNEQFDTGWFTMSPEAQALDYTKAFEAGIPGPTPAEKRNRLVFSDPDGYIYEYSPELLRGGLPVGPPATGVALLGSGLNVIVTVGALYAIGNGMTGFRLEVVHTDGTIDVRTVANNTGVNIVPNAPFSQVPTDATWYVGGIPAYWRSWVDSAGDPSSHKTLKHLWMGFNREFVAGDQVIDVSVLSHSDWPIGITRSRTAALTVHRAQILCSLTGRYFEYEFANTRPDEPFMISYFEPELTVLPGRRM